MSHTGHRGEEQGDGGKGQGELQDADQPAPGGPDGRAGPQRPIQHRAGPRGSRRYQGRDIRSL